MDAIKQAIIARGSTFEGQWRNFMAFCWNQQTINDATRLCAASGVTFKTAPDNPATNLEGDDALALTGGFGAVDHDVKLPHASLGFYHVKFAATDSRSVTFVNGLNFGHDTFDSGVGNLLRFAALQPLERQGVIMQIDLKVNAAWQSGPVDMTDVPWIPVCRDNPAGRVDEVVFMYGNAELDRSAPNYATLTPPGRKGPGLIATDIGCKDWTASLDMTCPASRGTGNETFRLKNVTLTNVMDTAAPKPGPTIAYPLSPGQAIQPPFGFLYRLVSGTVEWAYSAHTAGSSTCDYAGAKSYPITGETPVLTLSNFTPPGNASRSIVTPGLATNGIGDYVLLSADRRCTDSDGKVTTGTANPIARSLDINVFGLLSAVRVAGGGLSVKGTADQTTAGQDGDKTVTGTWSLTAVP